MASAATPLFATSIDDLKDSLRLGKIVGTDAALAIIHDAILRARSTMLRVLGEDRVNTILLTAWTAAPSTIAEVRRVEATQLEAALVKRYLVLELPTSFLDDAGSGPDYYEHEAPFRLTDSIARSQMVRDLETRANELTYSLLSDMDLSGQKDGSNTQTTTSYILSSATPAPDLHFGLQQDGEWPWSQRSTRL